VGCALGGELCRCAPGGRSVVGALFVEMVLAKSLHLARSWSRWTCINLDPGKMLLAVGLVVNGGLLAMGLG